MRTLLIYALLFAFLSSIGCRNTSINLAERINTIPPVDYAQDYRPDLPYDDMAKEIGKASQYSRVSDRRFRGFERTVFEINDALVSYAIERFDIDRQKASALKDDLQDSRIDIAAEYFRDMHRLLKTPEFMPPENYVLSFRTYCSVRALSRVLSSHVCTIAGLIVSLSVGTPVASVASVASQQPCEILLAEALLPIIQELQNHALIQDQMNMRLEITEHIRKMIMELAVVEDSYRARCGFDPKREIRFFFDSTAHLDMEVFGEVKAGFDLASSFSVSMDERTQSVTVTLPQPQILSVDVVPVIQNIQNGWAMKITEDEINQGYSILRERIVDNAINSGILASAEERGRQAVSAILGPMLDNPFFSYDLYVQIGNGRLRIPGNERLR